MPDRFPYHVTKFFAEYLPCHVGASRNTCKSYRDTFVQMLRFMETALHIPTDKISLGIITATVVEEFLLYIESEARVGISTRNQRLAAIHSFFKYLQKKELPCFAQCSAILSIPFKKYAAPVMSYLSIEEVGILFSIPDTNTRRGLRSLTIMSVLYETGARVQELIDLTPLNLHIADTSPYVELRGKGDKVRKIPIAAELADILRKYMAVYNVGTRQEPLFYNSQHAKLTRAGVQYIIDKYMNIAKNRNPGLFNQNITNHSFRHSKAMHLLEAGVNLVYIRDFLGHSSVTTTEIYARTNPEIKRKIITENGLLIDAGLHYQQDAKETLLDWLKNNL
jgi:site-specific recombinase XerD